jgi:hypothetical protein
MILGINVGYFLKKHIVTDKHTFIYRMPQEKRSVFREVIVSLILSKKVYRYVCPVPNGFQDRAISLYSSLYTVQTSSTHVLTRVAKCIDVDCGILENVLY